MAPPTTTNPLHLLRNPPTLTHSLSAPAVTIASSSHLPTPLSTNETATSASTAKQELDTALDAMDPALSTRAGEKRRASVASVEGWEDEGSEDGLDGDSPSVAGGSQQATGAKKPPRKRNRQALSCTECKRRKIKCDRKTPCEACCRRGEDKTCRWEAAVPTTQPQPFALATEHELLKARVQQLEDFIRSNGGFLPKQPQPQPAPASSEPPKEPTPTAAAAGSTPGANGRSAATDADTEDAAKALEDLGQAKLWEWASLRMNLLNQLGGPSNQQPPAA